MRNKNNTCIVTYKTKRLKVRHTANRQTTILQKGLMFFSGSGMLEKSAFLVKGMLQCINYKVQYLVY